MVCSRDARFAVCPIVVYSTRPPVSTVRTTTSPVLNADARFKRSLSRRRAALPVAAQFPLHLQSGIEPALRMVFVCRRCAEQREDAVAGRLHDVAVVALDRVDHDAQRRVDNRAGLFRVEVGHQFGRAFDIGEERSDHLALAIENFAARLPGIYSDARRFVAYGFFRFSC